VLVLPEPSEAAENGIGGFRGFGNNRRL
jgi:hypothetical protein